MTPDDLHQWFPRDQQHQLVQRLLTRVGMTRTRAECFVKLWVYVLVKQYQAKSPQLKPPLDALELPVGAVICTHREAANLFYGDRETGSDRAAGIMLDKLAALGLIKKNFDGTTTCVTINPIAEIQSESVSSRAIEIQPDAFNPRCDAIPIANLLATNYNWMSHTNEAIPHRIASLLRLWASQYATGLRVLRRQDNFQPVGFYLLFPTAKESVNNFFGTPSKSLHLSVLTAVDPFVLASPGDASCVSVFVRSWMIDAPHLQSHRIPFVQDVQQTLVAMQQDFPNLCDLYTLVIHPTYEPISQALGFQKIGKDTQTSIYWMYLALDRFLELDISTVLAHL